MKIRNFLLASTITTLLTASPLSMAASKLSSTDIASLAAIAVIDKAEIMISVVANNKKSSSGVTDFAKMMIDQHGSNLTQILDMVSEYHINTLTGSAAEKLKTQTGKQLLALGGLKDSEFDKAYVDAMVSGHEAALDLIEKNLLKAVKSEEVKKFLEETSVTVKHHLEAAKKLQEEMKS